MSLYGDAIAAMRRVILPNERVRTLSDTVRDLSTELRETRERLVRVEALLETPRAGRPTPPRRR